MTTLALIGAKFEGEEAWRLIHRLMDFGADICATGSHGLSFLHMFALMGDPELVKKLLQHPKADVTRQSSSGATCLHITMLMPEILKVKASFPLDGHNCLTFYHLRSLLPNLVLRTLTKSLMQCHF